MPRHMRRAGLVRLNRAALALAAAFLLPTNGLADAKVPDGFHDAEIVILGELHDNPAHHRNQASIIRDLQPDALVFEMIEPSVALSVTGDLREDREALERTLAWEESGWPDFGMYFPIFGAAPDAAVFGGAASREDVRRATFDGAAPVFGDAASLFGIDQPLEESQLATRLDLQREAHCNALPEEMLGGMVEAQRLRDAVLASATVAALLEARNASETPQVVVIAGNGHAREDWGVPALLRTYFAGAPDIDIRTLAQYERASPETAPYSAWLSTEPAERDDPCDVFRK